MKQVFIKKSGVVVEDVPAPLLDDDAVLVEVAYSLISVGTEMASLEHSGKSLAAQAVEHPQRVLKLLEYLRQQGLQKTIALVQSQLDAGQATGYSCSGTVMQVGKHVRDIHPGMPVACAGAGIANHAEIVLVPRNLVVKVPEGCDLADAASVTLGAIAMQGVRRADPRLGEIVAVIGLGLIGQITIQLLKAAGCRVIGVEVDPRRLELARTLGLDVGLSASGDDVPAGVRQATAGRGADSTIITAASHSDAIVQQAMEITRKKGRVVVVGAVGLGLQRSPFYEKEIDFLISSSYGPGRYDPNYEKKGLDYPYAYVRWTENRNMEEYLRLVADGRVNVKALIERQVDVSQAPAAYAELGTSKEKPLGVLLVYQAGAPKATLKRAATVTLRPFARTGKINVAVVGAGNFAKGMHLPNLRRLANLYHLRAVVSATGGNAKATAVQFGADYATTDYREVLADPDVDMVLICTRHHLHARQAIEAAQAGKAILLEKPMSLNKAELDELVGVLEETQAPFMVGYNRRFSPYAVEARRHTARRTSPLYLHYRMNAGYLPPESWVHGEEGGGRVVGEACHIIDLFTSFTGARIRSVCTERLRPKDESFSAADNVAVILTYEDGSLAVLEYLAVGSRRLPKEYMEIHFDEKSIVVDDYKSMHGHGLNVKIIGSLSSDKGQFDELKAFHAVLVDPALTPKHPIPLWDLVQTAEATFAIDEDK